MSLPGSASRTAPPRTDHAHNSALAVAVDTARAAHQQQQRNGDLGDDQTGSEQVAPGAARRSLLHHRHEVDPRASERRSQAEHERAPAGDDGREGDHEPIGLHVEEQPAIARVALGVLGIHEEVAHRPRLVVLRRAAIAVAHVAGPSVVVGEDELLERRQPAVVHVVAQLPQATRRDLADHELLARVDAFLEQLGDAFVDPDGQVIADRRVRELVTALGVLITSWPLGIALALVTLPRLAAATSWQAAMLASAVLSALALVLVAVAYRSRQTLSAAARLRFDLARGELALAVLAGLVWTFYNMSLILVLTFGPAWLIAGGDTAAHASMVVSLVSWLLIGSEGAQNKSAVPAGDGALS